MIHGKGKQGLASMSPEKRSAIASKGGKRAQELGTANRFTSETASAAGRKGGRNRRSITEIWCVGCGTMYDAYKPHVCKPCVLLEAKNV